MRDGAFGVLLRRHRISAGLTQEELANRAELSARTISALECGRTSRPFRRSILQLVAALGLTGTAAEEFTAIGCRPRWVDADGSPAGDGAGRVAAAGEHGATAADSAPESRWRTALVIPRQLPPPVRHFTGRADELAVLTGLLERPAGPSILAQAATGTGATAISTIGGMPGVGKTALAVHWAHQHADRFPDGQLYADLRGFDPEEAPMEPASVIRRFLDALAVPAARIPIDPQAQTGLYRSLLAGKRMLILLDNARTGDQVRPLIPGTPGCLVLVTSRNQLTDLVALDGAIPVAVDVLTPAEARMLLRRRLGADRVAREEMAAQDLIAQCARLPLALNIAAAHTAARPGTSLAVTVAELRDAHLRLDLLSAGPGIADVRAVFSWSYHALSTPSARLFRLLSVHPGPDITLPAAASLAAMGQSAVRPAMQELTAAHMLTEHAPGRYSLHDLLRSYAVELAGHHDDEHEQRCAIRRMLEHYLYTARSAALLLAPEGQPPELPEPGPEIAWERLADGEHAEAWHRAEQNVLATVIAQAASKGLPTHAWQLAWAMGAFPDLARNWQEHEAIARIALAAAKSSGDLAGQAHANQHLGRALATGGSYLQAHRCLEHARGMFARLGDRINEASTQLGIAMVYGSQHEPALGLVHSQQALKLYQAAGHRAGQAKALTAIGWDQVLLGQYEQALSTCEHALELAREIGKPYWQAAILDSIGYAYYQTGCYAEAVSCYQEALHLNRSAMAAGEPVLEGTILDHLGETFRAAGNHHAARETWHQALTLLQDVGHPGAAQISAKLANGTPALAPEAGS